MTRIVMLSLLMLAAAGDVFAGSCDKADGQHALNECYAREYDKAAAALNRTYRALLQKLEGRGDKALLSGAERAWLSYRDKQCAFETSGTEGGSVHPTVLSICLANKTRAHAAELNAQLHCPEGDLGCAH